MKITDKLLKKIILEEISRLTEEDSQRDEELLQAFLEIYKANQRQLNQSYSRFRIVDGPTRSEAVKDALEKFGMSLYELADELENFEGKISQSMYAELHDLFKSMTMYSDRGDEEPNYMDPEPENSHYEPEKPKKTHLKVVKQ
jgi:hypothetical protein